MEFMKNRHFEVVVGSYHYKNSNKIMKEKYGVFIIESLRNGDYFDGKMLKEILKLSQVEVQYKKVRDKGELETQLFEFSKSSYRYLHISCHASSEFLDLTDETVFYDEFSVLINGKVKNKRVFFSACNAGNRHLASIVIKEGGYSLIGSPIEIHFDKAALFWASFFHVVNYIDKTSMRSNEINTVLKSCVDVFQIPINYYSFISDNPNKIKRLKIRPNNRMDSRIINLNYKKTKTIAK